MMAAHMFLKKLTAASGALLLLLGGPMIAEGRPDVHQGVYRMLERKGAGNVLVTFQSADVNKAYDPVEMYKYALEHGKDELQIKSIDEFINSGEYHRIRGEYVLATIDSQHQKSREKLRKLLPRVSMMSSIPISNTFIIRATAAEVDLLSTQDDITAMDANDPFKVDLPYDIMQRAMEAKKFHAPKAMTKSSTKKTNVQWNIAKIGADQVWNLGAEGRGKNLCYAVADTGVEYYHENIRDNYIGLRKDGRYDHNYAWFDGVRRQVAPDPGSGPCGFASRVPCDDQGHGTHVTSTAVGIDGYGVAPDAKWMACRNMDRGVGSTETYLTCLNFFLAPHDLNGANPRPELRPHAIGNSYGCPESEGCSKHAMTAAVEALRAAGVFMSVSAGNSGPGCSTIGDPPAIEPSVISVGATDNSDMIAGFSSRGPVQIGNRVFRKPDLSAPGVAIMAAYPKNTYRRLSGTSMASPHVGGAAILIQAMCPWLQRNVDAIQALFEATAVKLYPPPGRLCGNDRGMTVPNNYYGYGRIDVLKAVELCRGRAPGLP